MKIIEKIKHKQRAKVLDTELYEKCKQYVIDGHEHNTGVYAYIEFYDLSKPTEWLSHNTGNHIDFLKSQRNAQPIR